MKKSIFVAIIVLFAMSCSHQDIDDEFVSGNVELSTSDSVHFTLNLPKRSAASSSNIGTADNMLFYAINNDVRTGSVFGSSGNVFTKLLPLGLTNIICAASFDGTLALQKTTVTFYNTTADNYLCYKTINVTKDMNPEQTIELKRINCRIRLESTDVLSDAINSIRVVMNGGTRDVKFETGYSSSSMEYEFNQIANHDDVFAYDMNVLVPSEGFITPVTIQLLDVNHKVILTKNVSAILNKNSKITLSGELETAKSTDFTITINENFDEESTINF